MSNIDSSLKSKKALEKIHDLDDAANAAMWQVESLSSSAERMTTYYGHNPRGSGSGDNADAIIRLTQAKADCNEAIDRFVDYKLKCMDMINMLRKGAHRQLLTLRYLNYMSWDEIAAKMNYSIDHVFKLHGHALLEFRKILDRTLNNNEDNSKQQ